MRRLIGVCTVILLSLTLCASNTRQSRSRPAISLKIKQLIDEANGYFGTGDYERAASIYQSGLENEIAPQNRLPLLIGAGNCRLATQQYQDALRYFAEADALARTTGTLEYRVRIASNRASVYRRMGDIPAALSVLESVEKPLSIFRNPIYLVQAASLLRDIDFPRSLPLFDSAIQLASEVGDLSVEALAWQHLGHGYLQHNDLGKAEAALSNTFRLRVANGRKQIQSCYFYLGQLRRRQGRRAEALILLTRAMELVGRTASYIPVPYIHYELALTSLDSGDYPTALRAFEAAVRATQELRLQILPSEAFRVSAEADLQRIFGDYVRAGMVYYRQTTDIALARRMMEVSEDSRAALFEQTLNSRRELPPEYWKVLEQYRRALAVSVNRESSQYADQLASLRLQLADLESRLGVRTAHTIFSHQKNEKGVSGDALYGLQRNLKSTETVLSFHSGAEESYLWALTRDSFETHFLPASGDLSRAISDFRNQLMLRKPGWLEAGVKLRAVLTDGLSPAVKQKPDWILSLDGSFFELPFAALPSEEGKMIRYLGHQHSLRTVPGVFVEKQDEPRESGSDFAAVADPRYNAVDPRWGGNPPDAVAGQQLARLPGTGREAAVCARAWALDPNPTVLRGADVNRSSVLRVISGRPAVLHLAAHVLPHPRSPDQVLIALGLQPDGMADYLSPADIAAAKTPVGLVTLSGCGSASGVALPGLGLFGLTRAWLVSGASAVVATYWPIADDSGEILAAMYGVLGKNPGYITASEVAKALQAAQIRMAASSGWRADPAYWSAFTVAGKD
jgi:tetratricopeptide (TPR) repeat protein